MRTKPYVFTFHYFFVIFIHMIKIAIDTLGSDNGSELIVQGIIDFLKDNKDVSIVAVGKKEELTKLNGICEIVDAPEIVPMEAGPLEVMRMKNSSMYQTVLLAKEGKVDAIVSSGSTGGFLSSSTLLLKTIPGVNRAAFISPFPTKIKGRKVVILDIGASNENSPEELRQFAVMGELYSEHILDVKDPKVYLLSNGTEDKKGSPVGKEAFKLLKDDPHFKGNIEARDALAGFADVVVTDGFTGNVFLKASEGMAKMMSGMIKSAFKKNFWTKLGYLHVRKGMKEMSETMDYKSTGGAMLLGVNGVVVKVHGNADAYSTYCAIRVAKKLVEKDIANKIKEGI